MPAAESQLRWLHSRATRVALRRGENGEWQCDVDSTRWTGVSAAAVVAEAYCGVVKEMEG